MIAMCRSFIHTNVMYRERLVAGSLCFSIGIILLTYLLELHYRNNPTYLFTYLLTYFNKSTKISLRENCTTQ